MKWISSVIAIIICTIGCAHVEVKLQTDLTYRNLWFSRCSWDESPGLRRLADSESLAKDGWTRATHGFYEIRGLNVGVEIRNISLWKDHSQSVIDQIKQDLFRYSLLVFRDQGVLESEQQLYITGWFGEPGEAPRHHAKSPDHYIWRLSNQDLEGDVGVGISGWHLDGSYRELPFAHVLYHMVNVTDRGDTLFISWTKVIEGLDEDLREMLEHLWSTRDFKCFYPLIYNHPTTNLPVMYIHTGLTRAFITDYGSPQQRDVQRQSSKSICKLIENAILENNDTYVYSHKWRVGDLIISDNLAVGHRGVSLRWRRDELRVLHRSQVLGNYKPSKDYRHLKPTHKMEEFFDTTT